jgi:hypothetical protein
LSGNATLSVGAPWKMLGVILPESYPIVDGTIWRKQ